VIDLRDWSDYVKIEKNGTSKDLPIQLGNTIAVDGYVEGKEIGIITHFHEDHMGYLDDATRYEKILMTGTTKKIAIALKNSRKFRNNFKEMAYGSDTFTTKQGEKITLYDADHIEGSAQVLVEIDNKRILYSGDFCFPSADTPKCDILVLDASHGNSKLFNQKIDKKSIFRSLLDEITQRMWRKKEPILIVASRGTLHEIMDYLDKGNEDSFLVKDIPFISKSDEFVIRDALYGKQDERKYIDISSPEGNRIIRNKSKAIIFQTTLPSATNTDGLYRIMFDRYAAFHKESPFFEKNESLLRVNTLAHSSYDGIIDYVDAVEPTMIITDGSRSGYAESLSVDITTKFGTPALSLPR
jgi:hypothetical protein